jgi:hypothetical protein
LQKRIDNLESEKLELISEVKQQKADKQILHQSLQKMQSEIDHYIEVN